LSPDDLYLLEIKSGLKGKKFAGFGYNGSGYESTISYQYDNSDRLTQVVDSIAGTITRTYDNFDNLIDEQTPQGEVTYSYDADHRLQTRTVVGETPVNYSWDAAGNPLCAVQGSATLSYAYDSAGRLSSMTLPNGVVETFGYDSDSRIAAITYSNGTGPLGNLTYSYDADGRTVGRAGRICVGRASNRPSAEVDRSCVRSDVSARSNESNLKKERG
jgi:YD repeat-containing protein